MKNKIILVYVLALQPLYGRVEVGDIENLKKRGETINQRMEQKDKSLYHRLFIDSRKDENAISLANDFLSRIERVFEVRLLPFLVDESTSERLIRTNKIAVSALAHLNKCREGMIRTVVKGRMVDIKRLYSLYSLVHAYASYPLDERPNMIAKKSSDKMVLTFFYLYSIEQCLKRMEKWDRREQPSIFSRLQNALKRRMKFPMPKFLERNRKDRSDVKANI